MLSTSLSHLHSHVSCGVRLPRKPSPTPGYSSGTGEPAEVPWVHLWMNSLSLSVRYLNFWDSDKKDRKMEIDEMEGRHKAELQQVGVGRESNSMGYSALWVGPFRRLAGGRDKRWLLILDTLNKLHETSHLMTERRCYSWFCDSFPCSWGRPGS